MKNGHCAAAVIGWWLIFRNRKLLWFEVNYKTCWYSGTVCKLTGRRKQVEYIVECGLKGFYISGGVWCVHRNFFLKVFVEFAKKIFLKRNMKLYAALLIVIMAVAALHVRSTNAFPSRVRDYDAGVYEVPAALQSKGPTPEDDVTGDNEVHRKNF